MRIQSSVFVACILMSASVGLGATASLSGSLNGTYSSTTTFIDPSVVFDVTQGPVTISGTVDLTNLDDALIAIGLLDKRVYDAAVLGVLPDGSATPAGFGSSFNASATVLLGSTMRLKDVDPESAPVAGTYAGQVSYNHTITMDGTANYDPSGGVDKQWNLTAGAYTPAPIGTQTLSIGSNSVDYPWGAWRHIARDAFFDASPWPEPELTYNGAYLAVSIYDPSGPVGSGLAYSLTAEGPGLDQEQPIPEPMTVLAFGSAVVGLGGYIRKRRGA
jgi:hypothetical protein